MKCEGGGKNKVVSDLDLMNKKTICPDCGKEVSFTVPNKKLRSNCAKLSKHSTSR
jgi:hypothetical protein